jgi:putative lipoic acid-binding regulatory protein
MEFTVGQSYVCTPIGFKHTITGTILNVYENTVVMVVNQYDPEERTQVIEKQNRVVVSKTHLEQCADTAA